MLLKSKKIGRFKIYFRNEEETDKIYKEVFIDRDYQFETNNSRPFIIDCGSHIGIPILFFKKNFPDSKILAFEPNPDNVKILRQNISENKLRKVMVINAALSDRDSYVDLNSTNEIDRPWTWGDSIVKNIWGEDLNSRVVKVKAVRLSNYITQSVDLLKLDIEGMETKVIQEIENKLNLIKLIKMEFHSTNTISKINNLEALKRILVKNKFIVDIKKEDLSQCFPKGFDSASFIKELDYSVYLITAINVNC